MTRRELEKAVRGLNNEHFKLFGKRFIAGRELKYVNKAKLECLFNVISEKINIELKRLQETSEENFRDDLIKELRDFKQIEETRSVIKGFVALLVCMVALSYLATYFMQ